MSGLNPIKIDNKYILETPEGVDLEIEVAGPLVRAVALSVDTLIKMVIQIACWVLFGLFGEGGYGLLAVVFFILEWFYPVFFEQFRQGQTPGKMALGLQVIHEDGTPITWGASMLRNLLRFIDFLPLAYLTGLVSMVLTRRFQRLGDLIASTLVVYQRYAPNGSGSATVGAGLGSLKPSLQPSISLLAEEQRALSAYAERIDHLSPERADALANLLAPLYKKDRKEGKEGEGDHETG